MKLKGGDPKWDQARMHVYMCTCPMRELIHVHPPVEIHERIPNYTHILLCMYEFELHMLAGVQHGCGRCMTCFKGPRILVGGT